MEFDKSKHELLTQFAPKGTAHIQFEMDRAGFIPNRSNEVVGISYAAFHTERGILVASNGLIVEWGVVDGHKTIRILGVREKPLVKLKKAPSRKKATPRDS